MVLFNTSRLIFDPGGISLLTWDQVERCIGSGLILPHDQIEKPTEKFIGNSLPLISSVAPTYFLMATKHEKKGWGGYNVYLVKESTVSKLVMNMEEHTFKSSAISRDVKVLVHMHPALYLVAGMSLFEVQNIALFIKVLKGRDADALRSNFRQQSYALHVGSFKPFSMRLTCMLIWIDFKCQVAYFYPP